MAKIDERDLIVELRLAKGFPQSTNVPFEICLALSGKTELLGLYVVLLTLFQKGYKYKLQAELARFCNLSWPTFAERRDMLMLLHVLETDRLGKTHILVLQYSLKKDPELKATEVNGLAKEREKIKFMSSVQAEQVHMDGVIEEKANGRAKEIVQAKVDAKKAQQEKFPREDYRCVIDAYQKYKGIKLMGADYSRVGGAISKMFRSGHSVKEIIDCIKFFHDHEKRDGYEWMLGKWKIETVMKNMPEFKGGKLKMPELGDDIPDV